MSPLRLSFRLLWREWRAGDLRVLALSILVAVAGVTAVGFFTDRVSLALSREANLLLAADLVLVSDHAASPLFAAEAAKRGLRQVPTLSFPSMVLAGAQSQLAEIKAVGPGYPLRGVLRTSAEPFMPDRAAAGIPQPGTVWLEARLLNRLGLKTGARLEIGGAHFTVAAVLTQEPDRAGNLFSIAPRLLMNIADVPATGLIQPGSHVSHRLLLAGEERQLAGYRSWAQPRLGRGERLEGVADARPEVRTLLSRAQRYLGLAALVSLVLAAAAVVMATRRFMQRHLDGCAILRCLGATQAVILRLYLYQFLWLGTLASLLGCAAGYAAQAVLADRLGSLIAAEMPLPSALPALQGVLAGLATLLAFALPALLQLKRVPAMRVLRRELGPQGSGRLGLLPGFALLAALLLWQAGDRELGLYALAGLALLMLLLWLAAALLVRLLRLGAGRVGAGWRFGVNNVFRRGSSSIAQVVAFGAGFMALLLLTLVRAQLLDSWQATVPPDAPNRFVINVQPDQLARLQQFFADRHVAAPAFFPMVRGRLVAVNGRAVSAGDYPDERAKHLVEREFNLSWASRPQEGNRIVAGRWWRAADQGQAVISVEQGIAETLGFRLGDAITFEVAGTALSARILSLRKVEWDSFRANFFVVAIPGLLDGYPASYMTSLYLPPGAESLLADLVEVFPNATVLDVAAIMQQVRTILGRVTQAVQFVFLFSLLSGVMVLYAAVAATRAERVHEAALLRTLGASRSQLLLGQAAEFATLGMLSGLVAAAGASGVGYLLSEYLFHLPYRHNPLVWLAGASAGAAGVAAAALPGVWGILRRPPLETMRELA